MYFRASSRDAIPSSFRLPRRFAPRNDTGLECFCLRNGCFWSYTVVLGWNQRSVFPKTLPVLSLRGGRNFLRPTRQSLTKRNGIPERNTENRNERYDRFHASRFVLCSHISFWDATLSTFRLPRRFAPRNDTKMVGFSQKPTIFATQGLESGAERHCNVPYGQMQSKARRRTEWIGSTAGFLPFILLRSSAGA